MDYEIKICLWCGDNYVEGMEGCCRKCWEENQFSKQDKEEINE
jgi:hypothetical protein